MYSELVRLVSRRPAGDYERGFVRTLFVRRKSPRNLRVERVIKAGWVLIVIKSVAVFWLFDRYHVHVNALWVIAPTVAFAALCTLVYLLRD
jgi:hypothetical protein